MKRAAGKTLGFVLEMIDLYFNKRVSRSAAELAYFLILSFFPALICINAIIGTLDLDVASLLEKAADIIPGAALTVLNRSDGWYLVNYNGTIGYASGDFITLN